MSHNAVSSLPVVSTIVLLENDDSTFHGSEPLALEVAPHPSLNADDETGQNTVSLLLQEHVILVLEQVVERTQTVKLSDEVASIYMYNVHVLQPMNVHGYIHVHVCTFMHLYLHVLVHSMCVLPFFIHVHAVETL